MGLKGQAAIVGAAQYKPEKYSTAPQMFHLEQVADLAARALADAGLKASDIDGLCINGPHFHEASSFVPAMAAEYLGIGVNFAEVVDLGGTTAVGMIWRAAAAIELGICQAVLCVIPQRMAPFGPDDDPSAMARAMRFGGHSTQYGAPEAEFDLPYGHMGQNTGYAMIAQRYAAQYGYDQRAMAKIAVDQRTSAQAHPDAIFRGQTLSIDDVLNSRMVADPLHVLEIVMPVAGGAAVIVASRELAERSKGRPAFVTGFGERLGYKSPSYAQDMTETPLAAAARTAFAMAGATPADMHAAQVYDCYTITVLLSLEDAGFCAKGEGMRFVMENDLTFKGNFPMNTHGGQLSFGQAGSAGGFSQVVEAYQQIAGKAGDRQLRVCDQVFVSGTGGVMSEQGVLILQGA
ncbi:thiolase family protein [Halopseudomonas aestusnigri]|jgi:acetyl-CoA acetyltransferase|uniref:thiolase family protein n=1 Tax=Halopseudomonas TaxID=2901189 RepID=UPI0022B666AC|nr:MULTISPECIES: thiolase family protein [Halopseudomonas]MDL2198045.1 thiolase family protein [Halopseudomonas aestusnigri]BDX20133.1 transporter [Halopseudomonas aestusnigri]